jgi:hypothetical protein
MKYLNEQTIVRLSRKSSGYPQKGVRGDFLVFSGFLGVPVGSFTLS